MGFNLDDYEPVADRIKRFYEDHPDGWIATKIKSNDATGVIVKAYLGYTSDGEQVASGHARGVYGMTGKSAQATSPLEDCETSAIGRALANAGYATKGGASREEMEKAQAATPVEPVDLLHLCQGMEPDELQRFKEALHERWPGIGLRVVHPDLVRDVSELAAEIVADRYAQPGEEPF